MIAAAGVSAVVAQMYNVRGEMRQTTITSLNWMAKREWRMCEVNCVCVKM